MHQKCIIRNVSVSEIYPKFNLLSPRSQSLKYCKNQNKHTYFFLYYLYLSHIYPKFNLLSLYPKFNQMHQKCIRNVSEIYPKFNLLSLDLSHSNTVKIKTSIHISPILPIFIPHLSQIQPSLPISHLLKYCKNPKFIIRNASEMYQKSIPNSTFSP